MRVGLLVNILNVVLNFLLIYPARTFHGLFIPGAGLGVTGAAIASASNNMIVFFIVPVCLYFCRNNPGFARHFWHNIRNYKGNEEVS